MPSRLLRTPLYAAFFCAAVSTACTEDQTTPHAGYARCAAQTTPIARIQGANPASALVDELHTVQGIVTLVHGGEGLYLEEPGSDNHATTSNAIFVQTTDLPAGVGPGSWISAQGTVTEIPKGRNSLTALTELSDIVQCSSGQTQPLTDVVLPLSGLEREAFEGMRIRLDTPLTVTDTYQFGKGRFSLSGNGFQFVATEVIAPGPEAFRYRKKNSDFSLAAVFHKQAIRPAVLATGSSIGSVMGVLVHEKRGLRLALQSITVGESPTFPIPARSGAGDLRVVGMNLHNFFNGDGKGGGFPTARGAKTSTEYDQQRQRLGAAIGVLNPHVLAVMELENDGFGPLSAAADFIRLASKATGASWQVARPAGDNTGGDKITVGLFYRDDMLEAINPAQTLTGPEFKKSRQPLAQVFRNNKNDEKLLIVVNHLKSKGSCPDSGVDANQKDGQGCWNPMRVASAEKMSTWVNSHAASTQTENVLILGDMNAYRQEDPIDAIRNAGFIELGDDTPDDTYSFVFFGQAGTLDYAFASAALLQKVQQTFIWNVNAALPANMELPQPWLRFSDHDPVVVDIRSRQSSTSD